MTVKEFFTTLFADASEPPFLPSLNPEVDAIYTSGQIPMIARITIGQGHGQYIMLPIPSSSDREQAYTAVKAHYAATYGPHVKITVSHLCSTPDDPDEGTVAHSAAVIARCDHGLKERICTVNVVTQGMKSC